MRVIDSSSDEDIQIKRNTRQSAKKKRNLEDLFDEEEVEHNESEESYVSCDYGVKNTLFYEIFGTGEEYLYILEDEEKIDKKEIKSADDETKIVIDTKQASQYISNITKLDIGIVTPIVEILIKGYNIHFALLHTEIGTFGILNGYKIVDGLKEYTKFLTLKEEITTKYKNTSLLKYINNIKTLGYYGNYINSLSKKLPPSRDILSPEEFCENLRNKEKLYEPETDSVKVGYPEEAALVKRIALHPIFIETVLNLYSNFGIENTTGELYVDKETIRENIVKFYLSDTPNQEWNVYRENIVMMALEKILTKKFFSDILKNKKEEKEKERIFLETIDRILNGGIEYLKTDEYICGVTMENKYIKIVSLDFEGDLNESLTVKDNETEALLSFINKINPKYIAIGGSTPEIKYLMSTLSSLYNTLFVERPKNLSKENFEGYALCTQLARMILSPEFEYSEALVKNNIFIKSSILSDDVISETIARGILTSVAIVGIDLNYLIRNRKKEGLISLIGMDQSIVERLSSKEPISELKKLDAYCNSRVTYENLATYLRIFPGLFPIDNIDILDQTPIHPNNYNLASAICKTAVNSKTPSNVVEEAFKNNKSSLHAFSLEDFVNLGESGFSQTSIELINSVYKTLLNCDRPIYTGLPDHLVFNELTGITEDLTGSELNGKILKVGDSYYIVKLEKYHNVTVYVKKAYENNTDYYLNQMVVVKITEINDYRLGYSGIFVNKDVRRSKLSRFCMHPLFKNLNSKESEEYLKNKKDMIVLRKSSQEGSPVVVIKLEEDVYMHVKITEENNGIYSFKGKVYNEIDEVISKPIKNILFTLRNIKKYKHYFDNESSALEYVNTGGAYIKYSFYFSRNYPGKLCFLLNRGSVGKEYIKIGENLEFDGKTFKDLDEFMQYRKRF